MRAHKSPLNKKKLYSLLFYPFLWTIIGSPTLNQSTCAQLPEEKPWEGGTISHWPVHSCKTIYLLLLLLSLCSFATLAFGRSELYTGPPRCFAVNKQYLRRETLMKTCPSSLVVLCAFSAPARLFNSFSHLHISQLLAPRVRQARRTNVSFSIYARICGRKWWRPW